MGWKLPKCPIQVADWLVLPDIKVCRWPTWRRVMSKPSTHHSGLVWGWSGVIYGTYDQDKHKKHPTNFRLWPWPWGSGADAMLATGVFPLQSRHGVSCSYASLGSSSIDVLASHSESAGSSMGPRSWGILTALTTDASAIGVPPHENMGTGFGPCLDIYHIAVMLQKRNPNNSCNVSQRWMYGKSNHGYPWLKMDSRKFNYR